ncbi:hypothetical protein FC093_00910 [Ilyomonas limi]|uniref:Uncharacterized protein n=1 Tax=Ilyomonas limi TaxID=2575867 RepID=A0A4U3L8G3_9BACT|nr:hypothetical protein [Ilyomonas limi]TKK71615.1 hypothetical protein FC093_00910 [Ilyomonas limi]
MGPIEPSNEAAPLRNENINNNEDKSNEQNNTENLLKSLKRLLELLNIKAVYYVDDENIKTIDFEVLSFVINTAVQNGKISELQKLQIEGLELDLPPEEVAGFFRPQWEEIENEKKKALFENIIAATTDNPSNIIDFKRSLRIKDLFPPDILIPVSPQEWDILKDKISFDNEVDNILVLFDQDLQHAGGKYFVTKGENLISEVKRNANRERIICTLLTHLIPDTNEELSYRKEVIEKKELQLQKDDFFPLTKKRIDDNVLFCDGIKKALLNTFCERIKNNSVNIIEQAYKNVKDQIENMDTYAFDHMILRSSYDEGVWEMETLFRISKSLYDNEVKSLMIHKSYPKEVNKQIKEAKALSDIRFSVDPNVLPYTKAFKLRHHEIYEPGSIINPLHLPLENGDIFSISEGEGKGFDYILIAQECDLMMRTNPLGVRPRAKYGTLLKLDINSKEKAEKKMQEQKDSSGKFNLYYIEEGTDKIGIVNFGNNFLADLDVLDLAVFNVEGKTTINLNNSFDVDLVSANWEHRYNKLKNKYITAAKQQELLLNELPKVNGNALKSFKEKIYLQVSPMKKVGLPETYKENVFSFGLKRRLRFKAFGAKLLLDKYYKYLSRSAELHDFAVH